jgi:hypothetical protein
LRDFVSFVRRSIVFVGGMSITLLSLCYLAKYAADFQDDDLIMFFIFFLPGAPVTLFGLSKLSREIRD